MKYIKKLKKMTLDEQVKYFLALTKESLELSNNKSSYLKIESNGATYEDSYLLYLELKKFIGIHYRDILIYNNGTIILYFNKDNNKEKIGFKN